MAAVTICRDFGAPRNKVCHCFHCFPIYLPFVSKSDIMVRSTLLLLLLKSEALPSHDSAQIPTRLWIHSRCDLWWCFTSVLKTILHLLIVRSHIPSQEVSQGIIHTSSSEYNLLCACHESSLSVLLEFSAWKISSVLRGSAIQSFLELTIVWW